MFTKKQVDEIRGMLESSQNPLFFFDNDVDGLCSFLVLSRFIDRGKGVAVKSFPNLDETYFRKVVELKPDTIFILDKPKVSTAFFDKVRPLNIPIVWIDHHLTEEEIPDYVHYFNPLLNKQPSSEPVTRLCYQVTQRKEDLWIAMVGCIGDSHFPDFYPQFMKMYPELGIQSTSPFEIVYRSDIGKIVKLLAFALKDTTSNVIKMLKFLRKVNSPQDLLQVNTQTFSIHKRFEQINNKYHMLLSKAIEVGTNSKELLFFQYGGDLSLSADLSNELCYKFPDKIIVIAYMKHIHANVSLRGKNVRELTLKAIESFEQATGGGHQDATGAKILIEDLQQFRQNLMQLIQERDEEKLAEKN